MSIKIKNVLLGCFLVSLFFACNSEPKIETKRVVKRIVKQVEDAPNKDSELALLMRKMYLDADSIKQLIVTETGTISDDFILELETVHTAKATDPDVKTAEFDAFNKSLISQAKVIQASSANQVEEFNKLVNRCIACHQSFCPGPIKRIKKLIID
jgi:cytochrome c556